MGGCQEGGVEGAARSPHGGFVGGLVEGWGGLLFALWLLSFSFAGCCRFGVHFVFVVRQVCRGRQGDAQVCCWRHLGVYKSCLER